jgi:hypothetical protein
MSEQESKKPRLGSLDNPRIAGPDDPIYKGGLVVTSLPRFRRSPRPPAVAPEPQRSDGDDGGDADG